MTSTNLSTPVSTPKSEVEISHKTPILMLGSCFAQNIGELLFANKFDININPNGIIFNPISVINSLKRIINNEEYSANELIEHNGKWMSLGHHSSFDAIDKTECLTQINSSLAKAHQHIKKTKTIIITLGSAWVYEYENFGVVANCHKIPNKQFTKRLLSVKEILTAFDAIKADLKGFNIVFTVSPVRHTKDGLHENNLSKSTLLLAINNLVEQHKNYHYFPAYELVIDELRDYRFYKDDLVHPTNMAVNYIWEKFSECYFDDETQQLNSKIKQLKTAAQHKPFHFESDEHQQFVAKQLNLMSELSKKHTFLNFEIEKNQLTTKK